MFKGRIALLALFLVGLLILTSCSFSFGDIPSDPGEGTPQDPANDQDSDEDPGQDQEDPGDTSSFTLYPAALDMPVGRDIKLAAGTEADIVWSSSNSAVAAVNQDGRVTALQEGESFISATVNESSAVCRISVTASGSTLAYPKDPGPLPDGSDGERIPPEGDAQEDNTPTEVPDDSEDVPDPSQCTWTILIDDGFDAELTTPMGISYMVNTHVGLIAEKEGGNTIQGIYQGSLQIDTAIDEDSFIAAMNSLGGEPITSMSSTTTIQTAEVTFSVNAYDQDTMIDENAAYRSDDAPPMIHSLTEPVGMAIASFVPQITQVITIEGEDSYGSGMGAGGAETPFLIEITPAGNARLFLPRLLSMMSRNSFKGRLVKRLD